MNDTNKRDERGSAAIWLLICAIAGMMLLALVVDGGSTMAAKRDAARTAEQAARVAADQTTTDSLHTGQIEVDPAAAVRAANDYIDGAGMRGTVDVDGDTVTVSIRNTYPTRLLNAFGMDSVTVIADATATTFDQDPAIVSAR